MTDDPQSIPLVVLEEAARDLENSDLVVGTVRVVGHPWRVVLDFSMRESGFVIQVEVPWMLGIHPPSQKAVIALMAKIDAGEDVLLPADLSDAARRSDEPFPFEPLPVNRQNALETAADEVMLQILRIERTGSEPARFALETRLDGRVIHLELELLAGADRIPVVRWIRGPDPNGFSPAQRHAIERVLLKAME